MDFARKQLEKYGWSAGKGLGRHENGISEALKPKLKRSVAGVGHDAAADFTEHWWNDLYNKAAKNLEVENKNGKTKRIKQKDDFEITNNTWQINKSKNGEKSNQRYTNFFIKTEILSNGGSKVENVKESDSEDEKIERDVFKMTDEELFAACEGRTAHKGARHGLKALGKLARIEQQEQILLNQDKYIGYSHTKKNLNKVEKVKHQVVENNSLDSDTDGEQIKIKKKKKKRCHKDSKEKEPQTNGNEIKIVNDEIFECKKNKKVKEISYQPVDDILDVKKKKKRKNVEILNDAQSKQDQVDSKDASDGSELTLEDLFPNNNDLECEYSVKSKKKKRKKDQ